MRKIFTVGRKSKGMQKFLLYAYTISRKYISNYLEKFSKETFTVHQIMVCLLIKEFMKCSFRDIEKMLKEYPKARKGTGLKEILEHFTLSRYFKCISAETRKLILKEMAEPVYCIHSSVSY